MPANGPYEIIERAILQDLQSHYPQWREMSQNQLLALVPAGQVPETWNSMIPEIVVGLFRRNFVLCNVDILHAIGNIPLDQVETQTGPYNVFADRLRQYVARDNRIVLLISDRGLNRLGQLL